MERLPKQRVERPRPAASPALVVGPAHDAPEREADHVARRVGRGAPARPRLRTLQPSPSVQRKDGGGGAGAGPVDAGVQRGIQSARGGGRPLPDGVRASMEQSMGADFGGVRVHTDNRADGLNRLLQARAFTTGQDIFFRRGEYNASSSGGDSATLAHELTHVVQQSGTPSAAGLIQRRIGFEFETMVQVRGAPVVPINADATNLHMYDHDQVIYRQGAPGQGWDMVDDSGRIEFVSDPLDTLADLLRVSNEIQAFITHAKTKTRFQNVRGPAAPGTWTAAPDPPWNRPVLPTFTVHVGSGTRFEADASETDWLGQPQVSVDVPTALVAEFLRTAGQVRSLRGLRKQLKGLIGTDEEAPLPEHDRPKGVDDVRGLLKAWTPSVLTLGWVSPAIVTQVALLVDANARALPGDDREKLRGLWTLMMFYWVRLRKHVSTRYRKAYLQALARTDFHSHYRDLSPAARHAFEHGQAHFFSNLQTIVDVQHGFAKLPRTEISLRRWYASVSHPEAGSQHDTPARLVDLLSAKQSGTHDEYATGTDESMGEHAIDAPGGRPDAIFELRRLTPGARIPIRFLYPHILVPIDALLQQIAQVPAKPRPWK